MMYTIPLDTVPNQFLTTTLDGETWEILLETRLGKLYISLGNRTNGRVIENRICLDKKPITGGFVFIDQEGDSDPSFELLGSRYLLAWSDELQ